ncbi:SET domain-containing protein, partial [Mytilinidion resinicola]
EVFVDSEMRGNWSRFLNHSCKPNASIYVARVGHTRFVAIRAARAIMKGEQITIDYQGDYFTTDFPCQCGEEGCK